MTERECLRLCRRMWLWLVKQPDKGKKDVPEDVVPGLLDMDSSCPCCEYVVERSPSGGVFVGCGKCPLKERGLWPNGCISDENSPYMLWCNAKSEGDRTKHAMQIADTCKERRKR